MGLLDKFRQFAEGLSAVARAGTSGDARAERDVFPGSDQPSNRQMNTTLIRNLADNAETLSPAEWSTIVEEHARFLESGGTGGRWELLSVSGLPLCIYQGAQGRRGEQAVLRLKGIAGLDASGAWLSWADLSGCYGQGVDLSGADLTGSVMIDSWFEQANFEASRMTDVDLSGARLTGANFRDADLSGADFEATDCTGADFRGANLEGARFPGAVLEDVVV